MKEPQNPFYLKGYFGPALFCDREDEKDKLITNLENGVNTTLLSIRRMGKTGLIHHTFHYLKKKNWETIYIDAYSTQNLAEFTNLLASSILEIFPRQKSIGKKFLDFITGFSPVISYDALTGSPSVSFTYIQPQQYEQSLKGLFEFLNNQSAPVVIAIDEFQQISTYPEKNIEAILRSIMQNLNNVNFIFSGSHRHLLTEMFNNVKRPFFSSTQTLFLGQIDQKKYARFITKQFRNHKKSIDEESVGFVLQWTRTHTYYTQALCNKLFSLGIETITLREVKQTCANLLKEEEVVFYQYRNLLTSHQWNLLLAIAKEERVFQPTAQEFIQNHKLGSAATVKRSLEALLAKEMIYKDEEENNSYYIVYDCFLSRWLERL